MENNGRQTLNLIYNQVNSRMTLDEKIDVNKELINKLLSILSSKKLSELKPEELTQLSENFNSLVQVKKIMISDEHRVYCSECKSFKYLELSCGCFSCSHLNSKLIATIQNVFSNRNENTLTELNEITCPQCNSELNESDLQKLDPKYKSRISEFKTWLACKTSSDQGYFYCSNCHVIRGQNMLPTKILACLHMCKFCISSEYLDKKRRRCIECNTECNIEALAQEMMQCNICDQQGYFMGDRMIEVSAGVLACCHCVSSMVNNGYCQLVSKTFTTAEKKQFLSYIYAQCSKCGIDMFFCNARKNKFTKAYSCDECDKGPLGN